MPNRRPQTSRSLAILCLLFAAVTFSPAASAIAQQGNVPQDALPDPTVESPAIKSQLDAVRGVEQMQALSRRLDQLEKLNSSLQQRLSVATNESATLRQELTKAKEQKVDESERRRALPELRLVAQIRTSTARFAEIQAGTSLYRVADGRQFRLQLTDGQVVPADVTFVDDGSVEIKVQDLDATYQLIFRPSTTASQNRPQPRRQRNND